MSHRLHLTGCTVALMLVAWIATDDHQRHPLHAARPSFGPVESSQSAAGGEHWSFNRPTRPPVPRVKNQEWVITPVDAFIAARHESEGLSPSVEADRTTLIRRLSHDLLGLPPSPEAVADFADDRAPDAYERAVDRVLASPHFGERMAVHWLDLVRYADTDGYSKDHHREVWMYRDWVIAAFNENARFDEFTREQLAGDLLAPVSQRRKIASGYNRLLMTSQEGCADPKEYTHRYAADRVRNVSSVWLGATIGCAECHDHKFDPFSSRDFYRLAAFFSDVQETAVGPQQPARFGSTRQERELARLDAEIWRLAIGVSPLWRVALSAQRLALLHAIPSSLVSVSGPRRTTRVQPRGNWADDSGELVQPGFPECLAAQGAARAGSRLDLGEWLTSRENPLVARVIVNRLWRIAFGTGLVSTTDDFGTRGAAPSHPELLDWLAVDFVERGWDVKAMLKLIVLSNTYRQASALRDDLRERDPANRWLARQNRFRLDAEFIRDQALAAAALLSPRIGGPSARPCQPDGFWAPRFSEKVYRQQGGEDLYRRGLYGYWCRNYLHPAMQVFDAPARIACTAERFASSTPPQALVLLNDPAYCEAARALAARMMREGGATHAERLDFAFRIVLSRHARPSEHEVLAGLYAKHRGEFAADAVSATAIVGAGESPLPVDLDVVDLAAWTSIAKVILNLHETVIRK